MSVAVTEAGAREATYNGRMTPDQMRALTLRRGPEEPTPDLTDYVVVHRAMTTDMRLLADSAARIADGREEATPRRAAAMRYYLTGIGAEIRSHHRVEDEDVWPLLAAVADADVAGLVALTGEHDELDPLLDAADALVARLPGSAAELAAVLDRLATLLEEHIAAEERDVFPVIRRDIRVADYQRLQERFRGNLSPSTLTFVVPWVVSHATERERAHLLGEAPWPLRVILRLFSGRFAARRALALG